MPTAPTAGLAASPAASAAARVPASFFSMVLGLAGLGAAWRAAARAYGVSPWLADALLAASAALWVTLLAAQVVKALVAREALRAELEHPVQGSLAALGPASLLLLASGIAAHLPDLARLLFWIGAAAQLALGVWLVGRWLLLPVDPKLVTPALYLPPVAGNLLAAIAAGAVGRGDAGWLFFGAGVVSWLLVGAALLVRYLSAGELPAALRPLVAIEIAPPAVALVAWQALEGGAPDAISRGLLGFALFQGLVVARLLGRLREVPFSPAYWAFSFPLAALAAGALRQAAAAPASVAGALALPLFVVANAAIAALAWQTGVALARGRLLPPA
jgi:tellurite resistance protein